MPSGYTYLDTILATRTRELTEQANQVQQARDFGNRVSAELAQAEWVPEQARDGATSWAGIQPALTVEVPTTGLQLITVSFSAVERCWQDNEVQNVEVFALGILDSLEAGTAGGAAPWESVRGVTRGSADGVRNIAMWDLLSYHARPGVHTVQPAVATFGGTSTVHLRLERVKMLVVTL